MSIASEISRLQSAKADLKTAIEAKGVTVPSSATLDDYDSLVAAISGGVSFEDSLTNNITSYTNETITSIREYAFQGLTHLTKVWLPALTTLTGFQPFDSTGIDALVLPNLSVVASSPTYYLRFKGTKIDLSKLATFGANLFNNSNNMNVLVVRNSTRVTLGNINAFQNTPFASGKAGGTLYVPSTLISEYQTATNWSTILGYTNNNIVAIEGSQYENYYADGTPISA